LSRPGTARAVEIAMTFASVPDLVTRTRPSAARHASSSRPGSASNPFGPPSATPARIASILAARIVESEWP
jgi:hypothetical protein